MGKAKVVAVWALIFLVINSLLGADLLIEENSYWGFVLLPLVLIGILVFLGILALILTWLFVLIDWSKDKWNE